LVVVGKYLATIRHFCVDTGIITKQTILQTGKMFSGQKFTSFYIAFLE